MCLTVILMYDVEEILTRLFLQNINNENLVCADVCLCDLAGWLECQNSTNFSQSENPDLIDYLDLDFLDFLYHVDHLQLIALLSRLVMLIFIFVFVP